MYKKLIFPLLIITIALISCKHIRGSGNIIERNVPISNINKIDLSGIGTVNVKFGKDESLTIKGDDNILDKIDVDSHGGTLELGRMKSPYTMVSPSTKIEYFVILNDLRELQVSGSGKIEVEEKINSTDFDISISGSGEIYVQDLRADNLDVHISGSGDCDAGGAVKKQKIKISGSGRYRAEELESQEAECRISGSGNVDIRVSDYIEASVSGSGNVNYWGRPKININSSGSGKVRNKGE